MAQLHTVPGPQRAEARLEMNTKLDKEIAMKQDKVAKGELYVAMVTYSMYHCQQLSCCVFCIEIKHIQVVNYRTCSSIVRVLIFTIGAKNLQLSE